MAEYLINVKIERLEESGKTYYLATSEDIQGLVAQADTLPEVIEIAQDSVKQLMDIHSKLGNSVKPRKKLARVEISNFNIPVAAPA